MPPPSPLDRFAKSTGDAVRSLVAPLNAFQQAVAGVQQQIGRFVQLANPAVFQQFTLAVDDFTASIGKALTPTLQVATAGIRAVADAIFSLSPAGQQAIAGLAAGAAALGAMAAAAAALQAVLSVGLGPAILAIGAAAAAFTATLSGADGLKGVFESATRVVGSLLEKIGTALTGVADAAAPLMGALGEVAALVGDVLAAAVQAVVPYLAAFARVMGDIIREVVAGVRALLSLIGVDLPRAEFDAKTSVGAAARGANIGGLGGAATTAYTRAFAVGTAASDSAKTASATEAIQKKADEIYQLLLKLPDQVRNWIVNDLPTALRGLVLPNGQKFQMKDGTPITAGSILQKGFEALPNVPNTLYEGLRGELRDLRDAARDFFGG